jgi:hypothetical protein
MQGSDADEDFARGEHVVFPKTVHWARSPMQSQLSTRGQITENTPNIEMG